MVIQFSGSSHVWRVWDCTRLIPKSQKFTPGDIPDNSPGQWQGSTSCLPPAAAPQNPTMPALFSDHCWTTLHCTPLHYTEGNTSLVDLCSRILLWCCGKVLVHLVHRIHGYCVVWSQVCIDCSPGRVWLVRLRLCTMAGIRDKPQKEGETPLLAQTVKFSNYCFQIISDFFLGKGRI